MANRADGIIVAIDGPAASGKSSTAQAVAARLGYRHLDSGAFYRALTLAALEAGIPPARWPTLSVDDVRALGVRPHPDHPGYRLELHGEPVGDRIRLPAVNMHVSRIASVPAVREWLLDTLRETGRHGGLVADGRDIGTVVFPDAELKIFLVCDPRERAARRLRQQGTPDFSPEELDTETRRLSERDRLDQSRQIAPLQPAPDAVVLDTTHLSFDQQVEAVTRLARTRLGEPEDDRLTSA